MRIKTFLVDELLLVFRVTCGAGASQTLEEDTVEVGNGAPGSAAGWYRCRAVSSLPRCPRAYYAVLFLFRVGDGEHF